MRSLWPRRARTLMAGAVALVALALPPIASAQPYDNTDPAASCSGNAFTLLSSPVESKFGGQTLGTVELRWSRTCNTGWARFTPASNVPPTLASAATVRPSDGARTAKSSGRYNTDWPIYAPQLNGATNCLVAEADMTWDAPSGGMPGDGLTPCAGGAPPAGSVAETSGGTVNTWTNYANAGGTAGPTIGSHATVHVACKVQGLAMPDGNTWWYRVATSPWSSGYYASADAFYNNGQTSGSLSGTPFVDPAVPNC